MDVEAEVHENYYAETDSDSEHSDTEVSHEDVVFDREIVDSQKTSNNITLSISAVHERTKSLKLTTDTLDGNNFLVNQ